MCARTQLDRSRRPLVHRPRSEDGTELRLVFTPPERLTSRPLYMSPPTEGAALMKKNARYAVSTIVFCAAVRLSAQSLPAGWTAQDIGAVGSPGSSSASGGVFTVTGDGTDIWGSADAFQ